MKKVYTLYAGVNGAGKTTLYNLYPVCANQFRVNSDEILRENNGDWRNAAEQTAAMKEAVKRIREYLEKGISFNQETTLAGHGVINFIQKAKERGYTVKLYYVGLESEELAISRVKDRINKGGHGIDEQDIRRRYSTSLQNLKKVIPLCDEVKIYDNTYQFELAASFIKGVMVEDYLHEHPWLEQALCKEENEKIDNHSMDMKAWRGAVQNAFANSLPQQMQKENTPQVDLPNFKE